METNMSTVLLPEIFAQVYGDRPPHHSWTIEIFDWVFGVIQPTPTSPTWIYLGPYSFKSGLSAPQVMGIAASATVMLIFLAVFLVQRIKRRE
jgi:hypothetical protein